VVHIADSGEQPVTFRHEIRRRVLIEETPDRERKNEVVNHWCPAVQRRATQPDVQRAANRVLSIDVTDDVNLRGEPARQHEAVALIGTLIAESLT
jgi:hypothetical protein